MDTPNLKIRGSWLIVNQRPIWVREPVELPEEDE